MEKVNTIENITRGSIKVNFMGRELTVPSEAYERGYGSPDFIIYLSMLKSWNAPYEQEPFSETSRDQLRSFLEEELSKRKMTAEFS